ncbi:MAG: hypothetical protein RSC44_01720, partial [Clostridia bacterium]
SYFTFVFVGFRFTLWVLKSKVAGNMFQQLFQRTICMRRVIVNMRLLQSLPCATWCMVLAISLGVVAKYAEKR